MSNFSIDEMLVSMVCIGIVLGATQNDWLTGESGNKILYMRRRYLRCGYVSVVINRMLVY